MDSQKTVRRISHYSSDMDILLVGEGDFSFAAALARAFQYAPCLCATSRDSREMLHNKYGELIMERRLGELGARGVIVLNEVDVRTVLQNPSLCQFSFDRIVYNFPHSGFLPGANENTKSLIRKHRGLMRAFFKSASRLLKIGGEVHVAQHMCEPYSEWKLEEEAAKSGLKLRTHLPFKAKAFSGYVSRRGDGDNANGTFCRRNPVTFIFFLPKSSSTLSPTLPRMTSPTPILSFKPPPCKTSPPLANKPSLSRAIFSHPCHVPPLNAPLLQKPQFSISIPCLTPPITPTINPLSLVAPKSPQLPIPCITPFSPQHLSRASNIIITLSNPSARATSEVTTRPPIFPTSSKRSKNVPQASYTNTSSKHQLIKSCKEMSSHNDPYKQSHPPLVNKLSHGKNYRLPSSDYHTMSGLDHQRTLDSPSCTSFLMWVMSCCMSCKSDSLT